MTAERWVREPQGLGVFASSGHERFVAEVPKKSGWERLAGVITLTPDGNC